MKTALHGINIVPFSLRYACFADFIWYHWIEKYYRRPYVLPRIKKQVLKGKKIIWNFHNKIPHGAKDVIKAREFMKTMAFIAHKIVIHCKETTDIIKEICGDVPEITDKIVFVPHPNYIDIYGAEEKHNVLQNHKLSLCFFGAVKKYKNIELLISAINELNFEDIEIKIIGRCRSKNYARKLKNLIGENNNIKTDFRFVNDKEIPHIIANSHLFVLPYDLNSSLNSGATILAFSYGRSVLSSLTGTLNDIKQKELFFTYSYNDPSEHKDKLKEQITVIRETYKNNYNELLKLGGKCKEYVKDNNSIEQVSKQLTNIFQNGNE
jgi:glycosyltransferase involved in cell wall biosynthesis